MKQGNCYTSTRKLAISERRSKNGYKAISNNESLTDKIVYCTVFSKLKFNVTAYICLVTPPANAPPAEFIGTAWRWKLKKLRPVMQVSGLMGVALES